MANRYLELQHFQTGLAATITWEVISNAGATLRALATGGVTEPRTGIYQVSVNDTWAGVIHWFDGTSWASERFEPLTVPSGGIEDTEVNVEFTELRVQ